MDICSIATALALKDMNRSLSYVFEENTLRNTDVVQLDIDRLQQAERGDDAEQQAMMRGIAGNIESINNIISFPHRAWSRKRWTR